MDWGVLIDDRMADGTGGAIAERFRRYCPSAVSDATYGTRRGATIR